MVDDKIYTFEKYWEKTQILHMVPSDMYNDVITRMRTLDRLTKDVMLRVHQGQPQSFYLFKLVVDELTRDIQDALL